jgi:hypothetical protein
MIIILIKIMTIKRYCCGLLDSFYFGVTGYVGGRK